MATMPRGAGGGAKGLSGRVNKKRFFLRLPLEIQVLNTLILYYILFVKSFGKKV